MVKINHVLMLGVCFALFSFTFSSTTIFQEDIENIGIIKQSLLKPNQFNKTQKGTWVLLDGSIIKDDTKLFELLEENFDLNVLTLKDGKYYLPDASGVFIRASNVNGEGKDPDKKRIVGSYQSDELKSHSHSLNLNGNDSDGGDCFSSLNGCGRGSHPSNKMSSKTGGSETRPVNISMYTYIKISN